jgi:hypothetical protein
MINEEHIIESLENASSYEWGVGRLDERAKDIVNKLREWAGHLVKVASKKRKSKDIFFSVVGV